VGFEMGIIAGLKEGRNMGEYGGRSRYFINSWKGYLHISGNMDGMFKMGNIMEKG
jgi:hypothetical protein